MQSGGGAPGRCALRPPARSAHACPRCVPPRHPRSAPPATCRQQHSAPPPPTLHQLVRHAQKVGGGGELGGSLSRVPNNVLCRLAAVVDGNVLQGCRRAGGWQAPRPVGQQPAGSRQALHTPGQQRRARRCASLLRCLHCSGAGRRAALQRCQPPQRLSLTLGHHRNVARDQAPRLQLVPVKQAEVEGAWGGAGLGGTGARSGRAQGCSTAGWVGAARGTPPGAGCPPFESWGTCPLSARPPARRQARSRTLDHEQRLVGVGVGMQRARGAGVERHARGGHRGSGQARQGGGGDGAHAAAPHLLLLSVGPAVHVRVWDLRSVQWGCGAARWPADGAMAGRARRPCVPSWLRGGSPWPPAAARRT